MYIRWTVSARLSKVFFVHHLPMDEHAVARDGQDLPSVSEQGKHTMEARLAALQDARHQDDDSWKRWIEARQEAQDARLAAAHRG